MAISQTIGINMPDDFPTTAHDAVNVKLKPCQHRVEWTQYAGGWNAIAFRFKTITVADETFTASIRRSPRPSFDEYQVQEEALFGFFVTGYAVIESFSYALFALGAMLGPTDFPTQLRAITPTSTQKKFATHFAGTPVEAALSALVADPAFKQWGCIRNVLAHRTAPSRNYFVSLHEGHRGAPPDDPDTVWQIFGGLPLNEQTTSGKRAWLASRLRHQQRDVVAGGAIDLHEVTRPEILDPRGVEGEHSGSPKFLECSHESRRGCDCQPPGQALSFARPLRVL